MANTKRPQSKNERQEQLAKSLVGQPVNDPAEAAANSGDYQGEAVPDEQANVDALQAEIAALKAQLETANAKPAKSPSAKSIALQAERDAMTHHATDAEVAALANTMKAPHYTYEVKSERIEEEGTGTLTHPSYDEFLLLVGRAKKSKSSTSTMKPHSEWKEVHHLTTVEVLQLCARAQEEAIKGTLNKAALGREFTVHSAFVNAVLTGALRSKETGIAKDSKVEAIKEWKSPTAK